MSDYVRNKAVMYPIDEVLSDKLYGELEEPFFIEAFDDGKNINHYLCYKLYCTYGEESGDFGRSRVLSETEQEKYSKLFSDYLNDIDPKLFKYVDYCYYNCCECDDYYLNGNDDFYNEV
jgi:hypothetical protein